jgi:hypothetical protein
MNMKIVTLLLSIISINACNSQYKILVTKDFILNHYWENYSTNYFELQRLKAKSNSALETELLSSEKNPQIHERMLNDLMVDSTFVYRYRSAQNSMLQNDTVYFGKINEGNWHTYDAIKKNYGDSLKVLSQLEINSWYKFLNLRDRAKFFVYVYIDKFGDPHIYQKDLSNY